MSKVSRFIHRVRNKTISRTVQARVTAILVALVLVSSLLGGSFTEAAALNSTFYVDNTNTSCSDTALGAGSAALPFCTLTKAANVAIGAGDTVNVVHGTYAETVYPAPLAGTSSSPLTFHAVNSDVTVTGNTTFGAGFAITTGHYITIDGFHIYHTKGRGIYVDSSDNIIISNNHVSYAGADAGAESHQQGIYLHATTASHVINNISEHNSCIGIRLIGGSNGNEVRGNVVYSNSSAIADPSVAISDAAGIELTDSNDNTVIHNISYGNEDTGINMYLGTAGTGSSNNKIIGNLTYNNGDHGIDNSGSPNNTFVGNTVQGNHTSGINFEVNGTAGSGGATLVNNIAVDNGLAPTGGRKSFNIYVDESSTSGTTMDYDLVWLSPGYVNQIHWGLNAYTSMSAFHTGNPTQETYGLQGNPLLAAPASYNSSGGPSGTTGDYHLTAGSPAIDSANSTAANEPSTDIEGNARVDDPATPNQTTPPGYDDRGAYEFKPGASTLPTVTTEAVTNIAGTTATGNGTVTVLGSPAPTQHGVAWGIALNPTVAGSHTLDGPVSATGPFTSSITGLVAGTLYHVRAYATNAAGTAYGSDVTFTAGTLPTVTTEAVTDITSTTATGNGNVTALGAPNPTQHGVAWGTTLNPTIAGSHTLDGPVSATGPFTSYISGLTAGTLYHVRAYATNAAGTAYGNDVTFTTISGSEVFNSPGTVTWTAPVGVGTVTVELWGGGGKGGSISSGSGRAVGGGGGGGAYSKKLNVVVIPGNSYTINVGGGSTSNTSPGDDSSFVDGTTTIALAKGGSSSNSSSGASGGLLGSGVGDTRNSGGSGANGSTTFPNYYGGGGGSSAGTAANGANGSGSTGGTAPAGGGSGGNGRSGSSGNGTAGSTPGGAGGGAYRSTGSTTYSGGNGANGRVSLTYTVRPAPTVAINCGAGTPSLTYGAGISCVATVTRTTGPTNTPTGTVAWTTGGAGTFATSPCALSGSGSSATCSVTYTPSAVGTGSHLISAYYSGDGNFGPNFGTQTVTVTAKALTLLNPLTVPASKIYDATTAAVVSGVPALQTAETLGTGTTMDGKPYTGDVVSILGTPVGTYNSKNVPTAATVAFSGLTLDGAQAGNYTLTITAPQAATITTKALTMSGLTVPASKVYNANLVAVVSGTPAFGVAEAPGAGTTLDGLPYTGDTISFSGTAVGTYNSKDVATANLVTFSGLTVGGLQGGNYSLTMQGPQAATITTKALTMSGLSVPASKAYNANLVAVVSGTPALAATEAPGAGNSTDGKPYTGDGVSITGTAAGTYNSPDVATANLVTFSGLTLQGAQSGNYTLTIQAPQAATITPKALTLLNPLTVPASKLYDATTAAVVSGVPALQTSEAAGAGNASDGKPYTGDVVSILGTPVGTYNSKNVPTANLVTFSGLTLQGAQNTNYTLTITAPQAATITPKALTMSGLTVPASKVYDATTAAVVSGTPAFGVAEAPGAGTTLDGLPYTGDAISFSGIAVGTYNSPDVATANQVTFSGLTVGGLQGGNYTLTMQAPRAAVITARDLSVSATADSRPYDGTTTATIHLTSNKVSGDDVTPTYTAATFSDKFVADGKTVTVVGISITGTDAPNYNLTNLTATTTANITPAALTVKANDANKRVGLTRTFAGTEFTTTPATVFEGDTITSVHLESTGAPADALVGDYDIVPSAAVGTGLTNYAITYVPGKLHVTLTGDNAPVITGGDSTSVSMSVNGIPTPFSLTLNATDLDLVDTLTWSISSAASNGDASVPATHTSLSGEPMSIYYVPHADFVGADSFVVKVDDGYPGGTDTITVNVTVSPYSTTYQSAGAQDGWVLESSEISNKGGSANSAAPTFNLGDNNLRKQYRGILSFNTSSLPDNAIVTGITLRIKQSTGGIGTNPFTWAPDNNILVDVKNGPFGTTSLVAGDFQALATQDGAMTITDSPDLGGWYSATLTTGADALVNKKGVTQFRLRFATDDNGNTVADYLKFYSGNAPKLPSDNRPQLEVQYTAGNISYMSTGSTDGQVLESAKDSNKGGAINAAATTLNVGDDVNDKQYRGILSFNTANLPDNAVVTKITLRIQDSQTGTGDPFGLLGNLAVDVKNGAFGMASLAKGDFQALATQDAAMSITNSPDSSHSYSVDLTTGVNALINKKGVTQFRLRFDTKYSSNAAADYLKLFSGNAPLANRPVLMVWYYVP